jgi:hypothetical protein
MLTRSRASLPSALLIVLSLLALVPAAAAQKATMLAWKWTEGAVQRYRVTQELIQTVTGPQEQENSWTVSYLVKQEVRSVNAQTGVATVAQTYESGKIVATEKGGERVEYDSTKPADADKANHRLVKPYAAFIGETITFDVDREGKVLKLEGAQRILAKAMSGLSESNPLLAPLLESYKTTLSDEGMRAELERQLRVVPARSVKSRDSWKVSAVQPMPAVGNVEHQTTYTFDRLRKIGDTTFAEIAAAGTLTQVKGGAAGGDPLSQMLDIKLVSSSVKGDVRFVPEEGMIASSSYDIETVWEIGVKGVEGLEEALQGLGGGGAGMKMEQRLRQRGGMELAGR